MSNDLSALYRYYGVNGDHFYTTNVHEIGTGVAGVIGKYGTRCEGIIGYVSSVKKNGLIPLYRYYINNDHFYTTNAHEIGTDVYGVTGKYGYKCEGIAGYVSMLKDNDLIPLYRYFGGKDHFYTTNAQEIGTVTHGLKGKCGYTSEGIACYIFPPQHALRRAEEAKKQQEATQRAQEAARRAEEAKKQQDAIRRAQEATQRAQVAARRAQKEARQLTEQLRQQKEEQRRQLMHSQELLNVQLEEKRHALDEKHSVVMDLARQILLEEKKIESFRMERNDNSSKIIITLGPTGGGKSTFCNRMFGDTSLFGNDAESPCKASGDSKSCTQNNGKLVVQIGSHKITIIDTPGFGDSFGKDRQHCNRLCTYLKGCGGINAFVLVRSGTQPRFDQAFQEMLKQYHEMFGKIFFERLIIIATRIDSKINKLQFEIDKTDETLRRDICDMFNLNQVIPVIPIGLESYQESIATLVGVLPSDKFVCARIISPIDGLKARHSALQSQENELHQQMNQVQSEIDVVNNSLNAL